MIKSQAVLRRIIIGMTYDLIKQEFETAIDVGTAVDAHWGTVNIFCNGQRLITLQPNLTQKCTDRRDLNST